MSKYPIQVIINGELVAYGDFENDKLVTITETLFKAGLKDAFRIYDNE